MKACHDGRSDCCLLRPAAWRHSNRLSVWLGLLLCLFPVTGRTQPLPALDEYRVRSFSASDGLLGSDVRAVIQGSDGFIYVANSRGVARFDGRRFEVVRLPGLSSLFVVALMRDQRGRLWIRTDGGEIGILDRGRFRALPKPAVPVRSWNETPDGVIWLGGDAGLVRVAPDEAHPYTYFTRADGLPSESVAGVFRIENGEVIALTDTRLARMVADPNSPRGARFESFGPVLAGGNDEYTTARRDERGLWFTARDSDGARLLVRYRSGTFRTFRGAAALPLDSLDWTSRSPSVTGPDVAPALRVHGTKGLGTEPGRILMIALRARDGSDWLALREVNGKQDDVVRRVKGALERIDVKRYARFTRVWQLMEDHEGTIWIGTDRGLVQVSPRRLFALTPADGLSADFTSPVLQTADGTLWVGTWGGGVDEFSHGRWQRRYTTANGLPNSQIRALFQAADGVLWIGTSLGYAAIRNRQVSFAATTQSEVRAFASAPGGGLWIATETALLLRTAQSTSAQFADILRGRHLWSLHRDRTGSLWIATERGLFRVVGDSIHEYGIGDGLRGNSIASIAEEPDGTLWFGSYDRGIHRWRGSRFTPITTAHGLHSDGIWRMLFDEFGAVWMSSDQGIARVPTRQLHAMADSLDEGLSPRGKLTPMLFTEADGMPNRESNRGSPAGWRLQDGRLIFNNLEGLVVISPPLTARRMPAPRTALRSARADERDIVITDTSIAVSSAVRQLRFEYTALSFIAPDQNRYRYRLDGYDNHWVSGGTTAQATYTGLRPGRFAFHVQSTSGADSTYGPEAMVSVQIVPRYWQTLWFRALVIASVLGALFTLYRYRVRQLLALQQMRLRIASDLHDDIGSNLSSIALLSSMLEDHDELADRERQQLRRINRTAAETVDALRDIVWLVNPTHGDVNDLAVRMRRIASDLLPGVAFTLQVDTKGEAKLGMSAMRHTLLVYKEALHNIRRHAAASEVLVALSAARDNCRLSIRDNGRGFVDGAPGEGNGLASMHRRATQLGGSLRVNSAADRGTHILLEFCPE